MIAKTYAAANDLNLVWEGTAAFEKRRRDLPPDQFDVCPCITRKGITNCGLFPKSIERAEWEADEPHRVWLAAKRVRAVPAIEGLRDRSDTRIYRGYGATARAAGRG
jgi:hypothetical protein